ncbi:alpha/beta hydrolase [Kitasatospora cinereorecta]|uniref:Alpha/beta hydrolase n=1 Tax=Kitasatospora cinereorecta TaxID=285560 RepID=A0ABW0VLV7_9ACTN
MPRLRIPTLALALTGALALLAGTAQAATASPGDLLAVNCLDKPYPPAPQLFPLIARAWEREAPTFGRYQAFDAPPCATWPAKTWEVERYTGPWNRRTAHPLMVIGNTFDPATQYRFAQSMQRELGSAVLVTVDMIEHCAVGRSAALNALVTSYLVDQAVPAAGQLLTPDADPFPVPAS